MLSLLFFLFSASLLFFAILVVCVNNPVYGVLSLIMSFISGAALMILLGSDYIAMMLIIVYVGAIAVLFLFIVMMLNIKAEVIKGKVAIIMIAMSVLIGAPVISWVIHNSINEEQNSTNEDSELTTSIATVQNIGLALYSSYVIHLEIAGIILTIAMIGAIMIVMDNIKPKNKKLQNVREQLKRKGLVKLVNVINGNGVKIE